jgi:hypothetical protein
MNLQKISAYGWENCYKLTNGVVDLIITGDVGPRIIQFGFTGGDNEFVTYPESTGKTGGDEWRNYGGHRFWHAPEVRPRTYYPDNEQVSVEQQNGFVRVTQPIESTTGIQKTLDISLSPDKAHATIIHRLQNHNLWTVELAGWALSVMAAGGEAIIPLPPRGSHQDNLQPKSKLALWAYTDFTDPRWTLGRKYILLRQDSAAEFPQKIGATVPDGWVAHVRDNRLFVKTFAFSANGDYPDLGSNVETFTNTTMLEVETLGPMTRVDPSATLEHTENWFLFDGVPTPASDADVDQHILPKIKGIM